MLLDSHVVLDVLDDGGRMGPLTRAAILDNQVFVSAASMWELTIKARSGRLVVAGDLGAFMDASGMRPLPVLAEHALRIGEIEGLPHSDPFDRLLLTQALVEGMTFWTWDRAILAAGLPFVRDARL